MNNIFDRVMVYAYNYRDTPKLGLTNPMVIVYAYFLYCRKHPGDPAMKEVQDQINVIPILEDSFIEAVPKRFQEFIDKYNEDQYLINVSDDMDVSDKDIFLYAFYKAVDTLKGYAIGWDEVADLKIDYYADLGREVAKAFGEDCDDE